MKWYCSNRFPLRRMRRLFLRSHFPFLLLLVVCRALNFLHTAPLYLCFLELFCTLPWTFVSSHEQFLLLENILSLRFWLFGLLLKQAELFCVWTLVHHAVKNTGDYHKLFPYFYPLHNGKTVMTALLSPRCDTGIYCRHLHRRTFRYYLAEGAAAE